MHSWGLNAGQVVNEGFSEAVFGVRLEGVG